MIDPRLDQLLSSLKMTQRRALMTQCDQQLERVVVDGPGEWTVYNTIELAAKVITRRDRKHVKPAPNRQVLRSEPINGPATPPAPNPDGTHGPRQPRLKVAPTPAPLPPVLRKVPAARFTSSPQRPRHVVDGPVSTRHGTDEEFDWSKVDLEPTATGLQKAMAGGLPYPMSFDYHADVLALQSVDIESADGAVRAPQRVLIRPETKSKGYPVLMFARGDVQVIMGFRNPYRPVVIAAYWTSLLTHDVDRPGYASGMAGGGRREKGHTSPGTVPKLVQHLRLRGAELEWDLLTDTPVEVTYRGEALGKIPVGRQTRKEVQFTWSRIMNKILAIDRRKDEHG